MPLDRGRCKRNVMTISTRSCFGSTQSQPVQPAQYQANDGPQHAVQRDLASAQDHHGGLSDQVRRSAWITNSFLGRDDGASDNGRPVLASERSRHFPPYTFKRAESAGPPAQSPKLHLMA